MIRLLAVLALALAATPALAHPLVYHVLSFTAGFRHPLTGADHILAMVAVGLWAALRGGRARWAWPATFVTVMLVGGVLGMSGLVRFEPSAVESGIAASIVVLGLLVAAAARLPTVAGAVLVGVFALFHGYAHGIEMPATGQAALYAAGFVLATAALHGVGLLLGTAARGRAEPALRALGALTGAAGLAMLLG
ncbi:MAG TPA: HupE/UreJ family protein [Hyphomicrobiales bacterium]|nr:HupE/UreJ family protein [Hyphomicrobiales bacterium]